MSLVIDTGKLTTAAGDAYGNYQGGFDSPANKASFGAALTSIVVTLTDKLDEKYFLKGLGTGVAPAASVIQLSISIANLENAKTPADAMAAALGILSGSAGTLEALLPPCPLKLTLTAITIAASAAQLGVQSNTDAVNDLISDLVKHLHLLPIELSGNGIGNGAPGGMSPASAAAAEAATVAPRIDPLVLDLDGDGIETTSIRNGSIILFDHDGDGIKTGTGWVKPDDGWLVLDRNGNGTIDSGHELFGVNTIKSNGQLAKDGFDALKDLDANQDDKVDSIDAVFANLRIWRDLNQDGNSQANELSTLSDNSITAININSTAVRNDLGNGNIQTAAGSFTRSNGTTGISGKTSENAAGNLDLLVSTFYRQFTTRIPLSDQAKSLPSLRGSGQVRDLNEAISLSTDLGETVASYTQQTTRQDQINQLDRFIDQWANTSEMKSLKEQAYALASSGVSLTYQLAGLTPGSQAYEDFIHKLGVVERFMGFTYSGANGQPRFTFLNTNSGKLIVSLAGPQIDNVSLAYERLKTDIYESLLIQTRLKGYFEKLDISLTDNKVVLNFQPVEEAFKAAVSLNPREGIIDLIEFLSAVGETRLQNLNWNATDFLVAQLNTAPDLGKFSEELSSWIVLFAAANEHTLIGSSRADLMIGSDGVNTIRTGDGNDIILGKGGDDDIYGGIGNDKILGGQGNDTIFGEEGNDFIDGGEDNDTINDYYGFNTIKGGDGNDTITSRGIIEGGKGDDVITATEVWSGDTYIFNLGDGKDTISDYGFSNALGYAGNGLNDTLKFGEGIEASTITLARNGNDLIFKINETDQVTIKDWFYSGFYHIETIQFVDGTSWDLEALRSMAILFEGTSNDDVIYGWNGKNIINSAAGNDTIYGGSKTDVIDGGTGNDRLHGRDGADNLFGGLGNDELYGGYGADILDGGEDNDYLDGGMGNDTYQFHLGSGKDVIDDYDYTDNTDVVSFTNITSSDITSIERKGYHLVITYGKSDSLTLGNYFYNSYYRIEQFKFSDGVSWDVNDIKSRVMTRGDDNDNSIYGYNYGSNRIYGLGGNDYLDGGDSDDVIDGGTGDDRLYGKEGSDRLLGGEGNDELYGGYGADVLDGGEGNDYLAGGMGDDTYQFGLGSGLDRVSDYDYQSGNNDVLSVGRGVEANQIWLRRVDNDLEVSIIGTGDKTTISNWYYGSSYHIEEFKTSDGKTLLDSQVDALVSAMAAFAPPKAGETTLPDDYQNTLNAVIAANWK